MTRLVDRFGRTGFAALTSLMWALPMAAWAGSSALSPIDKTAYPWIALSIGLVMLVVWLVLLTRLPTLPVSPRHHRFAPEPWNTSEKSWQHGFLDFMTGHHPWRNAA